MLAAQQKLNENNLENSNDKVIKKTNKYVILYAAVIYSPFNQWHSVDLSRLIINYYCDFAGRAGG